MSGPIALALLASSSLSAPFDLSDRTVVAKFHAEGTQIYECSAPPGGGSLAWKFREPIAALMGDGGTVGRHYAGPHWALDDGSMLEARMNATLPGAGPDDVPLLKLDVTENSGRGRLAAVTQVYRRNTRSGGLQGPCSKSGELRSIAYSADYVFAK